MSSTDKKTTMKEIEAKPIDIEITYNQLLLAVNGLQRIHLTKVSIPDVKHLGYLFENERVLEPHFKAFNTKYPEDETLKEFANKWNKLERSLTAKDSDFDKLEEEYKDTLTKEKQRQKSLKEESEKRITVKIIKIPATAIVPQEKGDLPICRALSIFYK